MISSLSPHYVVLQEDFNIPGPAKMAYRGQSGNFYYAYNLAKVLKHRQPIKTVGIMLVQAEVEPFTCKAEELHLVLLSLFDTTPVASAWPEELPNDDISKEWPF